MSVYSLAASLDFVRAKTPHEISLTCLATFLSIARRGRCNQKEIEEELGLSNAACSRNVSFWCAKRYDRSNGMGYVKRVAHATDLRFKELTLTKTGEKFYEALREASINVKEPPQQEGSHAA